MNDHAARMDYLFRIPADLIQYILRVTFQYHNENTPIQIYWKFDHQKMKSFR